MFLNCRIWWLYFYYIKTKNTDITCPVTSFLKELCFIIKNLKDKSKKYILPIINALYISGILKIAYEGSHYFAPKDTNLELPVQEETDVMTITYFYSPEGTPVSGKYVKPQIAVTGFSQVQTAIYVYDFKSKLPFESGAY